ncbi:MAG: hypothetical protein LAO09_04660 [Acidobacteriia bacterium]|nr:hypothetical protein [Terriglobia bacterium]
MKVLVVDDAVGVQWIGEQLEPRGFEVVPAPSLDAAFYLWRTYGPWDLVLTELWLVQGQGLKTGLELIRVIRALSPSQRMALYTADRSILASPVAVLSKPCTVNRLLRLLRLPVLPLS